MRTKTNKMKVVMLLALAAVSNQTTHAQNWVLPGNGNATATSILGTTNNIPLRMFTNNAERIHINANVSGKVGYVGIGTASPSAKLHVNGSTRLQGTATIVGATTITGNASITGNATINGNTAINGQTHFTSIDGGSYAGSILQVDAPATSSFYPSIGFNYNGDGNLIYGRTSGGGVLIYNYAGNGYSPVSASAFNVNSDRTLKKDIYEVTEKDYPNYLEQIRKIESITYRYKNELTEPDKDQPALAVREVPHVGFSAQSLPKAIQVPMPISPAIKAEMKLGYNLSDMAGLTLIGVKALDTKTQLLEQQALEMKAENQTLKNKVDVMEHQMKAFETALSQCCTNYSPSKNSDGQQPVNVDKASLEQNLPNPFTEATVIRYYLPANSSAVLKVMSLEGQQILNKQINQTGYGEILISGNTLAAGTYTYSLIVNGKATESKIMVLTK